MKQHIFKITKSHGGKEPFSRKKLYNSLVRSGLPRKECATITDNVCKQIGEGTRTKDIFKNTLRLVKKSSNIAAVHYSLKRSIFELGPSGHHFESYVAKYFEAIGYKTRTCKTLQGLFVKHEVDVIAERSGKEYFVECKFHNRAGIKNDIKIALYVKARWDDLKLGPNGKKLDGFYLATNTAFSLDAMTYATGTGLNLLGVNAPQHKSFFEEIKEMHLYPISSLKSLNKNLRIQLLERNIVLVEELSSQLELLRQLGMKDFEIQKLLKEILHIKGYHQ